jgi:hypothetical protein
VTCLGGYACGAPVYKIWCDTPEYNMYQCDVSSILALAFQSTFRRDPSLSTECVTL